MKKTFEDLKVAKSILRSVAEIGFDEPTPVQQKAIPRINSGIDVVGIAQTGTGKTAAYLLPVLSSLQKPAGMDPRAVILVPTRELAVQVGEEVEQFTAFSELRHASVFGGIGPTKHARLLESGIDVLIATPGRLQELYRSGALSLKKVRYFVIDEADRMLDMGFLPQIRQLLEILPSRRQNLLFSATFSRRVEQLAGEFLGIYEKIEVAPPATTVDQVDQMAYKVPNYRTKLNLIEFLLRDEKVFSRVIIFVKTKKHAEGVYKVIKRKVEGEIRIMHSNKAQYSRMNTIKAFKNGELRILITTDVSARGIDANLVSHVINFDVPPHYEDYVHRIGRTARAGAPGNAITLVDPSEEWHWKKIEELIRMDVLFQEIPGEVEQVPVDFEEKQQQLREIDRQKKQDNPDYKGAFHPRKRKMRNSGRDTQSGHPKKKAKRTKNRN